MTPMMWLNEKQQKEKKNIHKSMKFTHAQKERLCDKVSAGWQ